ncbi:MULTISPECIES: hypothetical protein [Myxococcus]|uniref:hypothetical protein n=1 Tax=Myxococcus TaxID=32 RepID=UPI00114285E0|nr:MULTISPECIES: hypothetical protein [Myxococcus]MCK8498711.1 hypothetical protein [Myxococcus fulvus]
MTRTRLSLVTAALLSVFLGACSPEPQPGEGDTEAMTSESALSQDTAEQDPSLAACTATAVCGTCTTLNCTGTATCSAANGPTGFATCDGVTQACRTCSFGGVTYNDGQRVPSSITIGCSAKLNGRCLGGPFAGRACVSSGQCGAECCNGTWQ